MLSQAGPAKPARCALVRDLDVCGLEPCGSWHKADWALEMGDRVCNKPAGRRRKSPGLPVNVVEFHLKTNVLEVSQLRLKMLSL